MEFPPIPAVEKTAKKAVTIERKILKIIYTDGSEDILDLGSVNND